MTPLAGNAYLKRFPPDQIEIDRAFVRDILVEVSSGALAQAIIAPSPVMRLKVVAEGVETEAQRRFLARLGCHSFQSYLFSPPVLAEEPRLRGRFVDQAGQAGVVLIRRVVCKMCA